MHQLIDPSPIMTETWKPIDWLPGGYEVSDEGQICNSKRHIIVPVTSSTGYLQIRLMCNGKRLTRSVHRLVARAFLGECPCGYEVNHKDGGRVNAKLENLEYVTRQQNLVHGFARRRALGEYPPKDRPRGEQVSSAKLTENQVREIRSLALTKLSFAEIGRRFGVTQPNVAAIVKRRKWQHIA